MGATHVPRRQSSIVCMSVVWQPRLLAWVGLLGRTRSRISGLPDDRASSSGEAWAAWIGKWFSFCYDQDCSFEMRVLFERVSRSMAYRETCHRGLSSRPAHLFGHCELGPSHMMRSWIFCERHSIAESTTSVHFTN